MQGAARHRRVGCDEGQHRGHVGGDHARAFGDAADHVARLAGVERIRGELGLVVGGHDRFRRVVGRLHAFFQVFGGAFEGLGNAVHRQIDADDPGRSDHHLRGLDAQQRGGLSRGLPRVVFAAFAGARVRAAGVADDRAHALAALHQVPFGDGHGRGLDLVGRDHRRRALLVGEGDQRQVGLALLDARVHAGQGHAGHGAEAAAQLD